MTERPPLDGTIDTIRERCPDEFTDELVESTVEMGSVYSGFDGVVELEIDPLVVHCPLAMVETPDVYSVTFEYRAKDGRYAEIVSVEEFVRQFEGNTIQQESLTEILYQAFVAYFDPAELSVEIEGYHSDVSATTRREL